MSLVVFINTLSNLKLIIYFLKNENYTFLWIEGVGCKQLVNVVGPQWLADKRTADSHTQIWVP
jgi:hypothetical protein